MKILRKRVKPKEGHLMISIPEQWQDQEIDVIMKPVDAKKVKEPIVPVKYRGSLKAGVTNDEIDQQIGLR